MTSEATYASVSMYPTMNVGQVPLAKSASLQLEWRFSDSPKKKQRLQRNFIKVRTR